MERETRLILFFATLAVLFLFILAWYNRNVRAQRMAIARLKHFYEQAILDGDKRLALRLGREYYSKLRNGALSLYDEQAIANDLSTIASTDKLM
jgi:hypothetical protein